ALYASQNFSNGSVFSDVRGLTTDVGNILERDRIASLQPTFIRPRFRTYSLASVGGEIESIDYSTAPATLPRHLSPFFSASRTYPALIASAGWSNAQRPALSISPADGISRSMIGRAREQYGCT